MSFENIKVVICDIDNTLITMQNRMLSDRNKAAVKELQKRGILFGLASGRNIEDIERYAFNWGFEEQFDFLVCMNGAQIYDGIDKKVYRYNQMNREMYDKVLEVMKPYDYVYSLFCDDGQQHHSAINDAIRASMQRSHTTTPLMIDGKVDELLELGTYKFLYRVPEDEMAALEAYVETQDLGDVRGMKTQSFCYEFTHKDSCKSYGLKKFCDLHNISLDDVMSFGDTSNDNDMLECSYGVCLKNGTDDTKALAKEITDLTCAEDGFADYLEKRNFLR